MTSGVDHIREMNEAVGNSDIPAFVELMHPDAVWEHNPGSGSPEEGVYEGREQIMQLFERILEGWEYMRPTPSEVEESDGVYLVRGELLCKHRATESVIVEQYEQRFEIHDGRMAKGRMVIGSTARG